MSSFGVSRNDRPHSSTAKFEAVGNGVRRIETENQPTKEPVSSRPSLIIPDTARYPSDEEVESYEIPGSENEAFEMHPNVPTPEPGYHEDLSGE